MSPTAPKQQDLRRNRLLDGLPQPEWDALAPWMELSFVAAGQSLYQTGDTIDKLSFPIDCVVALVQVFADGSGVQTALVGPEAAVGLSVFLGTDLAPCRALVQCAGRVVDINSAMLKVEFRRAGPFMERMLRCVQALMVQQAQIAACNRHHTLEQQLCRWMLLSLDRMKAHEILITHESVAGLLGARRETVSDALHKLQGRGLIDSHRGRIEVLDRPGLERAVCECYALINGQYELLLPGG